MLWVSAGILAIIAGSANAKFLSSTVAFMLAEILVYPNADYGSALIGAYVASLLIAGFARG